MPPKRKTSPTYSPPRVQRRAVPSGAARRPHDPIVPRHTERERSAIVREIARTERFGNRVTAEAYPSYIRPYYRRFMQNQQEFNDLVSYRDRVGVMEFARLGALPRLEAARTALERSRQIYLHQKAFFEQEYVQPIRNYNFFWQEQFSGAGPREPPPPPSGLFR